MKALAAAYLAGLIFAAGLAIGGMTQPAKVLAFLDVAGAWDPSLAFVMAGAIAVHATAYRAIRGWRSPLFGASFGVPTRSDLDPRLIAGGVCFGVGWGLGGYCPGPALTALAGAAAPTWVFVAGMAIGMALFAVRTAAAGTPEATRPSPDHAAPPLA